MYLWQDADFVSMAQFLNHIIIIIILFVLKVQKYRTIQAWYKQLTICDNYLKKKKK